MLKHFKHVFPLPRRLYWGLPGALLELSCDPIRPEGSLDHRMSAITNVLAMCLTSFLKTSWDHLGGRRKKRRRSRRRRRRRRTKQGKGGVGGGRAGRLFFSRAGRRQALAPVKPRTNEGPRGRNETMGGPRTPERSERKRPDRATRTEKRRQAIQARR